MFEIYLTCPDCGGTEWRTLAQAEAGAWCCANCGTVCTIEEMSATALEH